MPGAPYTAYDLGAILRGFQEAANLPQDWTNTTARWRNVVEQRTYSGNSIFSTMQMEPQRKRKREKMAGVNITYTNQVESLKSHKKTQPIPPEIKPKQVFKEPTCKWKKGDLFSHGPALEIVERTYYDRHFLKHIIVAGNGGYYDESNLTPPDQKVLQTHINNYVKLLAEGHQLVFEHKMRFQKMVAALE